MGHGSYRASDWAKLKNSRGISSTSSTDSMFGNSQKRALDKYNPRYINLRESCDSEDSPQSTPIIIGFDATGSMGYLAAEIAKNSLEKTITQIYDKRPVLNPHIMCAAFTGFGWGRYDDYNDVLQVTQFEADVRVYEQLLEFRVGHGGNRYGYDPLIWYFADEHTKTDSFNKRGKKGFIFGIGDEVCADPDFTLTKAQKKAVFSDVGEDVSFRKLYRSAGKKYEIFHIITSPNDNNDEAFRTWEKLTPGRNAVVLSTDIRYLSEVITSLMQLSNGMSRRDVLSQWTDAHSAVERAIATVKV